jgi:hypothetical protein
MILQTRTTEPYWACMRCYTEQRACDAERRFFDANPHLERLDFAFPGPNWGGFEPREFLECPEIPGCPLEAP